MTFALMQLGFALQAIVVLDVLPACAIRGYRGTMKSSPVN